MPRITFTADFDWAPPELNGRWLRAYKAGMTELVTTPCAAAAIAAGRAGMARGETEEPRVGVAEAGGDSAGRSVGSKAGARAER